MLPLEEIDFLVSVLELPINISTRAAQDEADELLAAELRNLIRRTESPAAKQLMLRTARIVIPQGKERKSATAAAVLLFDEVRRLDRQNPAPSLDDRSPMDKHWQEAETAK